MKVLVLSASPRRDGNSRALAEALVLGARDRGHDVDLVDLDDAVSGFLRDCRACRRSDGRCGIDDGYADLLHDRVLPADGIVYATPLHWYGPTGVLKVFFDRMFCYFSESYPRVDEVRDRLPGKRSALLISSEERYPVVAGGVVAQLQEMARYLDHQLIGVVNGVGNTRGEVRYDPSRPLDQARDLGYELFDRHYSDYRWSTERSNRVWETAVPLPR
jgi:multimeric flavodoxin WrbA